MRKLRRQTALALLTCASLLIAACSDGGGIKSKTYVLTVNSSSPSMGVSIGVTPAANNNTTYGTTGFSHAYSSDASFSLAAPALTGTNTFSSWSGCASTTATMCAVTLSADTTVTANYVTPAMTAPTVTVTPSSSTITTKQGLSVGVSVVGSRGNAIPTGTVTLTSGSYTSTAPILSSGNTQIDIPAGALSAGSDTLQAVFTPDTVSAAIYREASGIASVIVTVPPKIMPTVTVTPSSYSITTTQPVVVTLAVSSGSATPAGTVTLTSGSYTSAPVTLSNGSAIIDVSSGSLTAGSDTLVASYTPDSVDSSTYNAATGVSSAVTVTAPSVITVDQSSVGPVVSDQLLGMNMAYWYDSSNPAIVPAFKVAGIKSIRWPGGSGANLYHWATNTLCSGDESLPTNAFSSFIANVIQPGSLDVALSANYSTNAACNGPGDPAEAAAWVQNAKNNGGNVTHVTVGNENWGSWETDLHATPHDPATYASAAANGYYPQIKAVDANVLVGVGVNPYNSPPWDPIVLSQAKYDFVEYHFYAGGPGAENDTFLVQQAAQQLTAAINAIKAELKTAGAPNTPIFVGEIGSVYNLPGKQATSITQALYAGQILGEMMNAGVSRAAWWLGFGGCMDSSASLLVNGTTEYANFSDSLYGW